MLTAVYDYRRSALTFDFVLFLSIVSTLANGEQVHVLFVPDDQTPDGFKQAKFPTEQRLWRSRHLLPALCGLYNATYTICPTREFARPLIERAKMLYPKGYTLENPVYLYDLPTLKDVHKRAGGIVGPKASEQAKLYIKSQFGDSEFCTVTLRQSIRNQARDSNNDAWLRFVSSRPETKFIVLDDLDSRLQPWNVNVDLRMALYESAALNLGVNNGPMALCWCGTSPYLTLKMLAAAPSASVEHLTKIGLPPGSQFPWSTGKQRLIWKDDTFENITEAFEEIMN